MITGKPLILALMLIAVGACRPGIEPSRSVATVPIRIVHRDSHCLGATAKIELIRNPAALEQWWQPLARQQFPAKPLPQSLASIEFDRLAAIVVFLGSRPTAGYEIELYADQAMVQPASLTIPVQFRQPSPDAMVAQVMTSPCVVMTVPDGQYKTVTVRNRQGQTLLENHF